jgi:hypothetical protein
VKPLMHIYYILVYLIISFTPLGLGSNKCLALLRPVAIGDFLSPATIGGYRNTLVMDAIMEITKC